MCCSVFLSHTKTILVTGGAGFIGSHVAQALLQRGDTVIIVDNLNDYYNPEIKQHNVQEVVRSVKIKENVFFYKIDIGDLHDLQEIFVTHTFDVVCHLAARAGVRASIDDPQEYIRSNILGTVNLFECAVKYNVPHVVFASSSSVYGKRSDGPFKESDCTDFPTSPYAATKKSGEVFAHVYHHLYGITCSCLRFFTVYGPRGRPDMSPLIFLDAIYSGKQLTLFGDGTAVRDYTYIDNIVDGVLRAIDKPMGYKIFNLGCGNPIELKKFIECVEQVSGKKANIVQLPVSQGDVPLTHASLEYVEQCLGYKGQETICANDGMKKMYEWHVKNIDCIDCKRLVDYLRIKGSNE
jgi:UDP-glucuronate 4-epimerase